MPSFSIPFKTFTFYMPHVWPIPSFHARSFSINVLLPPLYFLHLCNPSLLKSKGVTCVTCACLAWTIHCQMYFITCNLLLLPCLSFQSPLTCDIYLLYVSYITIPIHSCKVFLIHVLLPLHTLYSSFTAIPFSNQRVLPVPACQLHFLAVWKCRSNKYHPVNCQW